MKIRLWILRLITLTPLTLYLAGCEGDSTFWPPDAAGPWSVGHTILAATDAARADKAFSYDVWYPVDAGATVGATATAYDLFGATITSLTAVEDVTASNRRFPLIVYSHGYGSFSTDAHYLTEALASHGFVVVAANHAGNSIYDAFAGSEDDPADVPRNRPLDVSFTIDTALAQSAAAGNLLSGRINAELIGLIGHSMGGYTALASVAGYDDVEPDTRIDAIVPLSPGSSFLTDELLSGIVVPTMLMAGNLDPVTPIVDNITRPWDLISAENVYRADFFDATHDSFNNQCDWATAGEEAAAPSWEWGAGLLDVLQGIAAETCVPGFMSVDEAHRLTRLYAVSFFSHHLLGHESYQIYLTFNYAIDNNLPVDYFSR